MSVKSPELAEVSGKPKRRLITAVGSLCDAAMGEAGLPLDTEWDGLTVRSKVEDANLIIKRTAAGVLELSYKDDTHSSNGVHGTTDADIEIGVDDHVLAEERWTAYSNYHPYNRRTAQSNFGTRHGNEAAQQMERCLSDLARAVTSQEAKVVVV